MKSNKRKIFRITFEKDMIFSPVLDVEEESIILACDKAVKHMNKDGSVYTFENITKAEIIAQPILEIECVEGEKK